MGSTSGVGSERWIQVKISSDLNDLHAALCALLLGGKRSGTDNAAVVPEHRLAFTAGPVSVDDPGPGETPFRVVDRIVDNGPESTGDYCGFYVPDPVDNMIELWGEAVRSIEPMVKPAHRDHG